MDRSEYVQIKIDDIPQEFIDEYNLTMWKCDGWIYFEILRGWYGLPQLGETSKDLLQKRLNDTDYYETTTTSDLWRHKWLPVMFYLMVNDFVIEYVGKNNLDHLIQVL